MTHYTWILTCMLLVGLPACKSPSSGPYKPPSETERNPVRANELARAAVKHLGDNPEKAESLLREALTLDIFCGPAHNNLGVLHLQNNQLYEAATEFEWARKLMPGSPDPRLNLALTLDRAGNTEGALQACETALEIRPDDIGVKSQLVRLSMRSNGKDDRIPAFLADIAIRGESEEWREWARHQILRRTGASVTTERP